MTPRGDDVVVGADVGAPSGRALVVRARNGQERGTATHGVGGRGRVERAVLRPDEGRAEACDTLSAEHVRRHDDVGRGEDEIMHRLGAVRRAATDRSAERGRETRSAA